MSSIQNISGTTSQSAEGRTSSTTQQTASTRATDQKIEKSAKEFESILLGTWLQQAEKSFGSLPGGDDDEDADAGKDQLQGMAMQSLGASMTASGGIGIAKMVSSHLHTAEDARVARELKLYPAPSG